ncbi:MAG: hypothetical protein KAR20_21895, partial [Candidatus Heimdallarchaeota archaeon]|nr:hypothetical protein [Candidatus Heimdallarchaeota archaeon]
MAWKMENDQIVVKDGHPVWAYEDGKESPFDAGSALARVRDLTTESVGRKTKIRELTEKFAPFEDIEDPAKFVTDAKAALETVANLKDKEFVDAGEVERIKRGVSDSYDTKIENMQKTHDLAITEKDALITSSTKSIKNLLVRGAFDRSEFIRDATVLSPSIAFATFGEMFSIEDVEGVPTAIGVRSSGEKIYSLKNAGSFANPDEVIEILVTEYTDKDVILKGTPGGGGSQSTTLKQSGLKMSEM